MPLDLVHYEKKARMAVKSFWENRESAKQRQLDSGAGDRGERASVTAGRNMDGFLEMLLEIIRANGLSQAEMCQKRSLLTLPGYYRPTKLWDLLVLHQGELLVAIELKSQIGPSFGNNFNNRTEEAIGSALDLWTAYREDAFGKQPPPFVGWLMMVEDAPASRNKVKVVSPHYAVFDEFRNTSYLERDDLLGQRMVKEQLYTAACVMTAPRAAANTGDFRDLSSMTSLRTFVTALAGHVATQSARLG
jgi:type II restriction enzyme